jgi:hypothetical protein
MNRFGSAQYDVTLLCTACQTEVIYPATTDGALARPVKHRHE